MTAKTIKFSLCISPVTLSSLSPRYWICYRSYAANSRFRMACNRFCISEWYSFDLPSYARLKRPSCGSYCFSYVIRVVPPNLSVCSRANKKRRTLPDNDTYQKQHSLECVCWSIWYVLSGFVRRLVASQHLTGCRSPLARLETIPGVTAPKITIMLCAGDFSQNAGCIIHQLEWVVKRLVKNISYKKWN